MVYTLTVHESDDTCTIAVDGSELVRIAIEHVPTFICGYEERRRGARAPAPLALHRRKDAKL